MFHTNIIAYCQQNRYVRLAIYTDLFTLIFIINALEMTHKPKSPVNWNVLELNLNNPLENIYVENLFLAI